MGAGPAPITQSDSMQPGAQLRAAARFVSPLSFLCGVGLPGRGLRRGLGAVLGLLLLVAAPDVRAARELGSPEVQREVERLVRLAHEKRLAERPMWWRLLHYRR